MKKSKRIWGVKCPKCLKRMFSFHVHDFKYCGCENETFIDGGRVYLRYGWKIEKPTRIYWCKSDGKYPNIVTEDRWPY
jgi:hypothetical protein